MSKNSRCSIKIDVCQIHYWENVPVKASGYKLHHSKLTINEDEDCCLKHSKTFQFPNVSYMPKKNPIVSLSTSRCSKSLDYQIIISPNVCTDCISSLNQEGTI